MESFGKKKKKKKRDPLENLDEVKDALPDDETKADDDDDMDLNLDDFGSKKKKKKGKKHRDLDELDDVEEDKENAGDSSAGNITMYYQNSTNIN